MKTSLILYLPYLTVSIGKMSYKIVNFDIFHNLILRYRDIGILRLLRYMNNIIEIFRYWDNEIFRYRDIDTGRLKKTADCLEAVFLNLK